MVCSKSGFLLALSGFLYGFLLPYTSADPTVYISNDTFILETGQNHMCIALNSSALFLQNCKPHNNNNMLWTWGTGQRLFNIGTSKCLGLRLKGPEEPLSMLECDSPQHTLSWRCSDGLLIGADHYKLAAVNGKVVARKQLFHKWRHYLSVSENLCDHNFQEIHTLQGNGMGKPCVFPFKYNNTWYHECTDAGRSDGRYWCATTVGYDKDKKWGYCPRSGNTCDVLWEKNNATHICYQFNLRSPLSWNDARASCQEQGGDLLSVMDLDEQEYISYRLNNTGVVLWIGLNQLDGAVGWQWSDGSALAFVNWRSNFTPRPLENKHCGVYDAVGKHTWHSFVCDSGLPYACKKYLTLRQHEPFENWKYYPTQCEFDWMPYNRYCYKLQKEEFSWSGASISCLSNGGDLMSVNSLADVEFLLHFLQHENVSEAWIGMSSKERGPVAFQWSDGSAVTFTSWQRHEPIISLEDSEPCVSAQQADGNWKTRSCNTSLFSICKKPKLTETMDVTEEQCDETWERHGAYCYGINVRKQTFQEASSDSYCPLATITNRFEQAFINSLISSKIAGGNFYFWIALEDVNNTGEYTWIGRGHRDVTFTNWNKKQPSHNGGCVAVHNGQHLGRWEVKDCKGFSAMSLCKKALTADIEEDSNLQGVNMDQACSEFWETEPHLQHCYKVFHHEKMLRKRTWQEAEDLCQEFGAHLVSFSNLDEEKFVVELLSTMFNQDMERQFWIGFNKRNPSSEGSWVWSDGTPVVSSFWEAIYTGDDTSNCAAYTADMKGVSLYCDAKLEWICKIPKGVTPKTPDWHIKDFPWVFYQGNNYFFYNFNADFASFEFVCGWMRSGITSIHTVAEQTFIHRRIKKLSKKKEKWWIGLVYENQDDGFQRWKDGSSVIYNNWERDPYSRNISVRGQQCAYMESDTGLWSYSDCFALNPAICKTNIMFKMDKYEPHKEDDKQKHGICPADWLYYEYKCFLIHKVEDGRNFDSYSASNYCGERGGVLATITSEIEQAFVIMQLFGQKNSFWIGLSSYEYDMWENGTSETYNNWSPIRYTHSNVNASETEERDHLCALISADHDVYPIGKWYLENCNHKGYGFICEKAQDISTHVFNGSDMFPVLDIMEYGDKMYRILSGNLSWYDAAITCQHYGANLVSIVDQYHQGFVTIIVHRMGYSHWIGYYSPNNGHDFEWTDGSRSLFTSWADEESPSDGNCVYIDTSGYWRAEDCDRELQGAVCLVVTGKKRTNYGGACPEDWTPFQDFCYIFSTVLNSTDFQTAEGFCKQQGSRILTVLHEEEDTFIRDELSAFTSVQTIWLNRMISFSNGTAAWLDGTLVNYTNWNADKSDIDALIGAHCATMLLSDGTWRVARCNERRGFVCKKQKDNQISGNNLNVTRTSHAVVPVVVIVSLLLSVLLICLWYLYKRKQLFTSPGLPNLQCTKYSSEAGDIEESILITELDEGGNK